MCSCPGTCSEKSLKTGASLRAGYAKQTLCSSRSPLTVASSKPEPIGQRVWNLCPMWSLHLSRHCGAVLFHALSPACNVSLHRCKDSALGMGCTFCRWVDLAFAVEHGKHALHGALSFRQVREGQLCLAAGDNPRLSHTSSLCKIAFIDVSRQAFKSVTAMIIKSLKPRGRTANLRR